MTTTTDEALGTEVGAALRAGTEPAALRTLDLGRVERGARHRRNRRRSAATATSVVLAVAMGWALTTRADDPQPAGPPAVPATTTNAPPTGAPAGSVAQLPVYAVLDGDEPALRMQVYGATPVGVPLPAVDVYTSGDETLVVRTMPASDAAGADADEPGATVAMTTVASDSTNDWFGTATEPVTARGADAGLVQLADDQWALHLASVPPGGDTVLIGRHMSSDRLLALAEAAATSADGRLSLTAPFALVEHVDAAPASTVVGPMSAFALDTTSTISTWLPPAGRRTLETLLVFGLPEAIVRIGDRDVLATDQGDGRTTVAWIDPSGVAISRSVDTADLAGAVTEVRLVDAATWSQLDRASSARAAAEMPEVARADVGGVTLIGRVDTLPGPTDEAADVAVQALCVDPGEGGEQCDVDWGGPDHWSAFDASFLVDGQWILAGHRSAADNPYGSADEVTFSSADGTCCEVSWATGGDDLWYVVLVDAGIDVVTTNIGEELGGPAGDLFRPPAVGG